MKKYLQTAGASALIILIMVTAISLNTQNVHASIKGEEITYSDGATVLKGYVAYNEEQEGKDLQLLWYLNGGDVVNM